jgi:hypothetical protein
LQILCTRMLLMRGPKARQIVCQTRCSSSV